MSNHNVRSPNSLQFKFPKTITEILAKQKISPFQLIEAQHQAARRQLKKLNYPNSKDEEWRFTDISSLSELTWLLPPGKVEETTPPPAIDKFLLPEAGLRIVFIDGNYSRQLSSQGDSGEQIIVTTFSRLEFESAELITAIFSSLATFSYDFFATLSLALIKDIAIIYVKDGFVATSPLQLLYVNQNVEQQLLPLQSLLIMGEGSQLCLLESYQSLAGSKAAHHCYLNLPLTQIYLAKNAQLEHVRMQEESNSSFHFANCSVLLGAKSSYQQFAISLGAKISRYNLSIRQDAVDAKINLDGLSILSDLQLADIHSCIEHNYSGGQSRQLHKYILANQAHGVFNGQIMVAKDVKQIIAKQTNHNLLLSPTSQINSKPQLNILSSDVQCAHGVSIGQLDEEEVFYLQSRGLGILKARNLLSYAFAADIIRRLPLPSLRLRLEQLLSGQMGVRL